MVGKGHMERQRFKVHWAESQGALAAARCDDRANIVDIRTWHEQQEVNGIIMEETASRLVIEFVPASKRPIMLIEQEIFSVMVWLSWDVRMRLHYAGKVRWVTQTHTKHHPFGWGVRVRVMLAGGARDLVMGESTKGEGHHLWTNGILGLLSQLKNMVFGPQAGVGGGGGGSPHTFLFVAVSTTGETTMQ